MNYLSTCRHRAVGYRPTLSDCQRCYWIGRRIAQHRHAPIHLRIDSVVAVIRTPVDWASIVDGVAAVAFVDSYECRAFDDPVVVCPLLVNRPSVELGMADDASCDAY